MDWDHSLPWTSEIPCFHKSSSCGGSLTSSKSYNSPSSGAFPVFSIWEDHQFKPSSTKLHTSYHLILIVLLYHKAIVEQITWVTFFTVRIEYLHSTRNVLQTLYHESLTLINVVPRGLLGKPMVEHICKWRQNVCFDAINVQSKDSAAYDGTRPTEIPKFILPELLTTDADSIIVFFEIIYFLVNLYEERGSHEFIQLLVFIVDREIGKIFRQKIKIQLPLRLLFL